MTDRKFIMNADDFGMTSAINKAVLEAYDSELLKSASLVANGINFDDAINNILPKCPELGVGIHLNVTDGQSLCDDVDKLTDNNFKFKNSYLSLLIKAYNPKDKEFMEQLEREFRCQIEKIMFKTKVSHIDSHRHIHSIPKIFELVCKLAKEYGINQVRTHYEKLYIVPAVYKHFAFKYLKNIIKTFIFGTFTIFNEATIHKYGLKTNDYIIGLIYDSMMDALAVSYGTMAIKNSKVTTEVVLHPCRYDDGTIDCRFDEYLITKNKKLKVKIENLGYEITNYVEKKS